MSQVKPKSGKKRWRVTGSVSASTYVGEYEAETEEQAKEMAWKQAHVSVCHYCADSIEDPEVTELFAEEVED